MNTTSNLRRYSWSGLNWLLLTAALTGTGWAGPEAPPVAIPFSDVGARAIAGYQGDALGIKATADGARLRCGFQKLEGHATPEGLWLESAAAGGGRLRLSAIALWRAGLSTLNPQPSTVLPATGKVSVADNLVRFARPCLTEEYSVSVDGLRQDFIIESPPLHAPPSTLNPQHSTLNQPTGDLRVELALSGARAEATADGVKLTFENSGRGAYSRLQVQDATGRELAARLEVLVGRPGCRERGRCQCHLPCAH